MKKIITLCVIALCCIAQGFGQTPELQAFEKKANELETKMQQAVKQKDYKLGEKISLELIRYFESQPKEVKQNYSWALSNYYYNLSCYQSLLNKKGSAIKSLAKAVEEGYADYRHTLKDTDLDNLRNEEQFKQILAKLKVEGDYLYVLKSASGYLPNERTDTLPKFSYMNPNDPNLVKVRKYFNLDSVAGAGDEISKIKKILTFVHDKIKHDGQHNNPNEMNAIALAEACKDGSRGLNCRGLATVLNECYLAMGFKSRFVTCMPKKYISDCHVINAVYSNTLDKWIWVDPTNNAWVMDDNGTLLSISEVRERLRDGRPIVLNEEANWNNKTKQTKDDYIDNYMAKNLYCIFVSDVSEFNTETPYKGRTVYPKYVMLAPEGFVPNYPYTRVDFLVSDDKWFWQSPYSN